MRLSLTLLATLLSTTSALPSLKNPFLAKALAPRQAQCYTNRISTTTTPDSACAADCTVLQGEVDTLFNNTVWSPSAANGFGFDIRHGTCGLALHYRADTSGIPDAEFRVTPGHARTILLHSVEQFAVDGKVSSEGSVHCLMPGQFVKSGWAGFEVYKVEDVEE